MNYEFEHRKIYVLYTLQCSPIAQLQNLRGFHAFRCNYKVIMSMYNLQLIPMCFANAITVQSNTKYEISRFIIAIIKHKSPKFSVIKSSLLRFHSL